jgi:hypothetical protein
MQIFFALLYGCLNNLILIGKLLAAILAILALMFGLQLYDRFTIRAKLVKVRGDLSRRLHNLDVRLINFFDNRK